MSDPQRKVQVTVDVPADQLDAFNSLYREFITGEAPQAQEIRERAADREQGEASLRELVKVAQRDSGQCYKIARFLAGVYNGQDYPFDLTDLRAIDDELFEHCMAVLRMDHRCVKEVHNYFPNGGDLWQEMIQGKGLGQEQLEAAAQRLGSHLWYEGKDSQQKSLGNQLVNLFKQQ